MNELQIHLMGGSLVIVGIAFWVRWISMILAGQQQLLLRILYELSSGTETEEESKIKELTSEISRLDQFQWVLGLVLILLGNALLFL